jgi:hypothetical protein
LSYTGVNESSAPIFVRHHCARRANPDFEKLVASYQFLTSNVHLPR